MIHPSAIIENGAIIGSNTDIGAFSYIGRNVVLGDNINICPHVIIDGHTKISDNANIYPYATIGMVPQDFKYNDEITYIEIGKNCTIREQTTIHLGTKSGNSVTRIGDNCYLMVGSHVAHDCCLGNNVILIQQAALAGHVVVDDFAIVGGLSAVKQHVRIGKHAYIAGMTFVEMDILPYGVVKGLRKCYLTGVNIKGLRQRGFSKEEINLFRNIYIEIFDGPSVEIPNRAESLQKKYADNVKINTLLKFILDHPERHLCLPNEESIIK